MSPSTAQVRRPPAAELGERDDGGSHGVGVGVVGIVEHRHPVRRWLSSIRQRERAVAALRPAATASRSRPRATAAAAAASALADLVSAGNLQFDLDRRLRLVQSVLCRRNE